VHSRSAAFFRHPIGAQKVAFLKMLSLVDTFLSRDLAQLAMLKGAEVRAELCCNERSMNSACR
jgi:hypothetical protein